MAFMNLLDRPTHEFRPWLHKLLQLKAHKSIVLLLLEHLNCMIKLPKNDCPGLQQTGLLTSPVFDLNWLSNLRISG